MARQSAVGSSGDSGLINMRPLPIRLYSFGQLQQQSGAPVGSLKHWIDAGAVLPTGKTLHSGTGNPRQFPASEMIVVQLLTALAAATVSLGHLVLLSRIIRHALRSRPRPESFDELKQKYRGRGRSLVRDIQSMSTDAAGLAWALDLDLRYWELGRALGRAVRGEGTNLVVFLVDPEAIHFKALSDENGNPPRFDLTAFSNGAAPSKIAMLTLNLTASLAGTLD